MTKTPGVYIKELDAFPNSVVEVATSVPAFVGYTERADRGGADLTCEPTRITSMGEFEALFGVAPRTEFKRVVDNKTGKTTFAIDPAMRFLLHHSIRMFFENGGGACWIVSIGGYHDGRSARAKIASDFTGCLEELEKVPEPSILVAPDAVLLGSVDEWAKVANAFIEHCVKLQSRITLLDVYEGWKAQNDDPSTDVIDGEKGFRKKLTANNRGFAAAYYPWVQTSTVEMSELDFLQIDAETRKALQQEVADEFPDRFNPNLTPKEVEHLRKRQVGMITALGTEAPDGPPTPEQEAEVKRWHSVLLRNSRAYREAMSARLQAINTLPPAGAMAGVYARIDTTFGVFKAPANTGIVGVTAPTEAITRDQQEGLNTPLDGKAINAIRTFANRGTLVWGAHTLDSNSADWRYINVRRTMIMLEQSIKAATTPFVFQRNDAGTWLSVKNMIENFLNNQWKSGALAGTKPAEAYDVSVGLGSTMTGNDILDGYMRVTVRVAVVRPAEFIVLTFQQKMQTS